MKQVLLFDTAIGTTNVCDELILDGVKEGLRKILDNSLTLRLGTHIENWSPLNIYRNGKVDALCKRADYKFICGTNCLTNDLRNCKQWYLNRFNKVLYENSILVGVGRISDFNRLTKYTIKMYNNVLSKKYKHSVRDNETKNVLESIGISAINTGCPTLWKFTDEICAKIPRKKASNVILSVSGYKKQINVNADKEMLKTIKKNYKKIYVWIQTTEDERYLNELNEIENIEPIYSLNKFANILDNEDVEYVGTRLHGGIFALQHNKRAIIISIDERARGFHESNNIPILERENIKELDNYINSEFETKIFVNRDAINEFINQF